MPNAQSIPRPEGLVITKLHYDEEARTWRARVSMGDGEVVNVQSRPCWSNEHKDGESFHEVRLPIKAALSSAVNRIVNKQKKQEAA